MFLKLLKKKNRQIKQLRHILKNVRAELKASKKLYENEIGRIIKKQNYWQSKAENIIEYKASIQELLKQIESKNEYVMRQAGHVHDSLNRIESNFVKIEKNIENGMRNLQ